MAPVQAKEEKKKATKTKEPESVVSKKEEKPKPQAKVETPKKETAK